MTKASKKAANAARPSEEERKEGKTGLEDKDLPNGKDLKKKVLRGVEDAKDDTHKQLQKKAKAVSPPWFPPGVTKHTDVFEPLDQDLRRRVTPHGRKRCRHRALQEGERPFRVNLSAAKSNRR